MNNYSTRVVFLLAFAMLCGTHNIFSQSIGDLIESGEIPARVETATLDLSNKGITSLYGLGLIKGKENVGVLNLSNNKLTTIDNSSFISPLGPEFPNLRRLDLSHNELEVLPSSEEAFLSKNGPFSGLGELRELNLSNNKLTGIKSGTFTGLGKLKILYLGKNPLEQDNVSVDSFNGINPWLQRLVFSGYPLTDDEMVEMKNKFPDVLMMHPPDELQLKIRGISSMNW